MSLHFQFKEADWTIEGKKPNPQWPDEGKVVLKDYATRYRPGLDLVIKGISCDIKGGEKVSKGSGKIGDRERGHELDG